MTAEMKFRLETAFVWAVMVTIVGLGVAVGRNLQIQEDHNRRIELAEHTLVLQQEQTSQTNVRLASMQASLDLLLRAQANERMRTYQQSDAIRQREDQQ